MTKKRFTVTKARDRVWRVISTCGYSGYLPKAPGTYASILACVLLYFLPLLGHIVPILIITVAGIVAVEKIRGNEKDPGYVVIDEFVGMLITMVGHSPGVWSLSKGFILFRAFDILKPYPVRRLERLPGAFGIIADDVAAAIFANIALLIWERLSG